MKKRLLNILMVLMVVCMAFAGCSGKSEEKEKKKSKPTPTSKSITYEEARDYVSQLEKVKDLLEKFGYEFGYDSGKLSKVDVNECLEKAVDFLNKNKPDYVEKIEKEGENIKVTFTSGAIYIWKPPIEGLKSKGEKMHIASIQAFLSDDKKFSDASDYIKYTDDAAKVLDDTFDEYIFKHDDTETDDDYNDEEVKIDILDKLPKYKFIIWDGHGCYVSNAGCCLALRDNVDDDFFLEYSEELMNGEMYVGEAGGNITPIITPEFIRNHFKKNDFKDAVIYLGACESCRDESLVKAFLSRGATAVYANTKTITSIYNYQMIKGICKSLASKDDAGKYTTFEGALKEAKSENGDSDPVEYGYNAEVKLYYKDGVKGKNMLSLTSDNDEESTDKESTDEGRYEYVTDDGDDSEHETISDNKEDSGEDSKEGIKSADINMILIIVAISSGVIILILVIVLIIVINKKKKNNPGGYIPGYGDNIPPVNNNMLGNNMIFGNEIMYGNNMIPDTAPTGYIKVVFGENKGKEYKILQGKTFTIGRDPQNDMCINHHRISRKHCTIQAYLQNGIMMYKVVDSSTNGTYISIKNRQNIKLSKGQMIDVSGGTTVALGDADNVIELI